MKYLLLSGLLWMAGTLSLLAQETSTAVSFVEPQMVTVLTTSSQVYDEGGRSLGYLEGLVIDQESGKTEFALVSLANPAYRSTVTPIPWQLMQRTSESVGGTPGKFQKFTVAASREMLLKAPQVNMAARAGMNDLVWMTASYQYFGMLANMGGIGSGAGTQTGGASSAGAAGAPTGNVGTEERGHR